MLLTDKHTSNAQRWKHNLRHGGGNDCTMQNVRNTSCPLVDLYVLAHICNNLRCHCYPNTETSHLTHWDRVTHICIGDLTIVGSDNVLSPGERQAIIWTIIGILLIAPLRTNFDGFLIEIHIFWFRQAYLNMSSGNLEAIFSRTQFDK